MTLFDSLQQLSRTSMQLFSETMEVNNQLAWSWWMAPEASTAKKDRAVPCCPPEQDCPPHCLTTISRTVHTGEVVMIPFYLKNPCNQPKTYRIGLRPLLDPEGETYENVLQLDKTSVTMQPGQAVVVRVRADLTRGLQTGKCYTAEIVVREKEVNQNICLRLCVDDYQDLPTVHLREESDYLQHFQSWEHHFYCEPKGRRSRVQPISDESSDNQ